MALTLHLSLSLFAMVQSQQLRMLFPMVSSDYFNECKTHFELLY